MSFNKADRARPFNAPALAALFTGLAISGAAAHVSLANAEAVPNRPYKAILQVPHGCDGAPTTALRVRIPEGVIAVKPMPKAGWTVTTTRGEYAKAYADATVAQAGGGHQHHGGGAAAGADTFKVGDITVASPWARATPGGAKVAGGYLKVTNNGAAADRLVGGASDIAGRVEFHEMAISGGVMRMRPLDAGLELKPGQTVELTPGGYHMMFMDLKRQLKRGETVKARLQFEKAGTLEVTFTVGAVGGSSAPQHHH